MITDKQAKKISRQYPASLAPGLPRDDSRHDGWKKQRKRDGFDQTEIWNVDITFAKLMLPRVKCYFEQCPFIKDKKWKKDMKTIIAALELMASGECWFEPEQEKVIQSGIKKFGRYIRGMWI